MFLGYAALIYYFDRPIVSFTLEEKESWVQGPDTRTTLKDYAINVYIKPIHKLHDVSVVVISIVRKTFEDKNEHPLNSNIEFKIGWLGGEQSWDPVDIDVAGRPWPIVFIATQHKSIYMLCDKKKIYECKNLYNLDQGLYEVVIRVHSRDDPDIDQKLEFSWFGNPELFKIHLDK